MNIMLAIFFFLCGFLCRMFLTYTIDEIPKKKQNDKPDLAP